MKLYTFAHAAKPVYVVSFRHYIALQLVQLCCLKCIFIFWFEREILVWNLEYFSMWWLISSAKVCYKDIVWIHVQYNCVHLNTCVFINFQTLYEQCNSGKSLDVSAFAKLGSQKSWTTKWCTIVRDATEMSGLFKKYFVLLAFKRTLSIKFTF